MSVSLRPYQEDLVQRIRSSFRQHRRVLAVAPTGAGKCLGRGTPVLMFDGRVKPVESINVDDLLMGPDSQPRRVVSLARGREEMFRVVPVKGDPYTVNRSHILSLKMTNGSYNSCGIADDSVVNLSVDDYLARNKTFRHCAKGWRSAVDFPKQSEPLKLDPYFLGAWLGDGTSRYPSITTGDPEVVDYLRGYSITLGLDLREEWNSEGSSEYHLTTSVASPGRGHRSNPIKLALHQYNLLQNKHIPLRYLAGSKEERLAVLAGIMDTDGHWSGRGFELTLKSERLLDDVIYIARSLGFSAYKVGCRKTCGNNGAIGNYWRCNINGPVETIPCLIARKKAPPRRQIKSPLMTGISVESIGDGDYFGFEIEGPDRLFLLGDFTVTHNTVVFSYITTNAVAKNKRVIIAAHRVEIIQQISDALTAMGVRHGRIQTGHTMTDDPVQVAMIITLGKRLDKLNVADLLVIDEAHHATSNSYQSAMAAWPKARILGVTATPERLDGKGLGDCFDDMVIGPTMIELIAAGFLAPYTYLAPPETLDLSGVKKRNGDFAIDELADAMKKSVIVGDSIGHYRKHLNGRPAIAFCVNVDTAEQTAAQFRASGYRAASVDGTMDHATRRDTIAAIGDGRLNVLTSCQLISEGTDIPVVAGAILLRPTLSLSMYLQQVGRCLRPKPDGGNALILDHVGNVHRHGLPDAPREWSLDGKTKKEGGIATCKECFRVFDTRPGWKAEAECDNGQPEACILNTETSESAPATIEVVEGELVQFTTKPDWANGLDIATARGPDFGELLDSADTEAKLRQIAKARGYKSGWVRHVMSKRHIGRRAA